MKKFTTTEFINKALKVHGTKYDYSDVVYVNSHVKIKIKCPLHGEFVIIPYSHLQNHGCPHCGRLISTKKCTKKISLFILQSKKIHNSKYDYSMVNYKNSHTKIKIICPDHGLFSQTPDQHLRNHGCPKCVGKNKSTKEFIEQCKKIHGNRYDYSNVKYVSGSHKINIICKKHGIFKQIAKYHLVGEGCSICNASRGEQKIQTYLEKNNIIYEHNKTFENCKNPKTGRRLKFDFYLTSYNLLIEFDGRQHFQEVSTPTFKRESLRDILYRDDIKNQYAFNSGIKLLRIPYWERTRIDDILSDELTKK